MAAYFTGGGGGGGTDIQATDGLQTLYLMNPSNYTTTGAPTNMVLLNSMNSLSPVTLTQMQTQPHEPQLQYKYLWAAHDQQQQQQQTSSNLAHQQQQGGGGGLTSLTLSSRELPSVPVPVPVPTQSKYLKAAQELLDEVVSVGGGRGGGGGGGGKVVELGKKDNSKEEMEAGSGGEEEKKKVGVGVVEMTTAERQEMQMKKAKLVNMLDEVEQRYRQYHHQMHLVASSFEAVAGPGSARTYTSLALQTISKQFRCLRDAITGQIRSVSNSLGEDVGEPNSKTVGSRLRFIDHQLRQQRALQQLGVVNQHHGAWRPQRGLPERSVSILRAWLFEHFLHPYPKDSDKIMLAKQTGLTRSQVSNWFINARVRLWKPMVEEMYLEETKDQEKLDNTGAGENSSGNTDITDKNQQNSNNSAARQNSIGSKPEQQNTSLSMMQTNSMDQIHSAAMLTDHQPESFYGADEELMQGKLKKVRCDGEAYQPSMVTSSIVGVQPRHHDQEVNNRELLMKFMEEGARVGFGSTGTYAMAADPMVGRFNNSDQFAPHMSYGGNGNNGVVSLTLGLPHCDVTMPMSGAHHQQSFLSNEGIRVDQMGTEGNVVNYSVAVAPHVAASNAYDIDMRSRKPFSAHLMRDFVA